MAFFSKKQEIDLETVNRIFYESYMQDNVVDGVDINALFYDAMRSALVDADHNFANIDLRKFNDELVLLQFEIFALAWLHQFGDNSAVAQSIFTKNYLHDKARDDIWNGMEKYNSAISRSSVAGLSEIERAHIIRDRANCADKHIANAEKSGATVDEGIGRPLNRLFSEKAWKKGISAGFILFALCKQLGFDPSFQPNEKAHSQWFIEISDCYNKARKFLSKYKIK